MTCTRTQGFYDNATQVYNSLQMKGHGGIDIDCGFGSPIEALLDGYVYSVFDDKHLSSEGYWAVFMICEYKGEVGELCVGHVSKLNVSIGQNVKRGDIIAFEGNHGTVFFGQTQITIAMQKAGDERGHHRHWQWRPLKKSTFFNGSTPALIDFTGKVYRDSQDYCYLIPDYTNGYRGLSPLIANILNDYTDFKLEHVVVMNIEPESDIIKEQKSLIEIMKSYLEVLKNLFK